MVDVWTRMACCRVYCGGKAATHEYLKHLALFPPEQIHMRTVVEAVRAEAPLGCCTADAAELRQTCTEVYNQEIITYHSNRIRRWIDKQHQDTLQDDHGGQGKQFNVPSQSTGVGRVLGACTAQVAAIQPPMRG